MADVILRTETCVPIFSEEILAQFTLEDTLAFFEKLGVAFTERNGWLYPRSNQAKCIPELLILKARALKVKIKTREHAESVSWENGRWKVETSGWTYEGDKVILANGSKASQARMAAAMSLQQISDIILSAPCLHLQDFDVKEMFFLHGQVFVRTQKLHY